MVISQVEDYVLPVFDTSSPPAPAEKIKSTIDLIDFNAEHNPNALFCIQMEEHDVLLEISYKTFRDMISRSQAWVEENIHTVGRDESNKMSKPHSIALFMDSDVGLLAYLFALMGLGIPVRVCATLVPNADEVGPTALYASRATCDPVSATDDSNTLRDYIASVAWRC
jgi:acyl-coenzyme A synthetase/AMP-(fatty) acid ligase